LLTNLERLNLNYGLTGTIPTEIGILTKLESPDLDFNELMGRIPTDLGMLTNLLFLFLTYT
jgi:Leucine-rich repeat (LRR) protein